jgi:hypothetical protein
MNLKPKFEHEDRTLEHYEQHAKGFWEGTRDHNVSQNVDIRLSDEQRL